MMLGPKGAGKGRAFYPMRNYTPFLLNKSYALVVCNSSLSAKVVGQTHVTSRLFALTSPALMISGSRRDLDGALAQFQLADIE